MLSSTAKKKAKIMTRPNAWAQLARKEKGARYLKEERTVGFIFETNEKMFVALIEAL